MLEMSHLEESLYKEDYLQRCECRRIAMHKVWCGRQNNGPQRCPPFKNPEPLSMLLYVDFAGVIKVRLLGCGEFPGVSMWPKCNDKGPRK